MKAIILAAGQGSRLRPLTDDKPKCLVKYQGKPILDYILETMSNCGINDIAIATGYCQDSIDSKNVKKCYKPNYDQTNMVESLFCAEEWFNSNEDLIISYGDIIYSNEILNKLINAKNDFCVVADKEWHKLWSLRMEDPLSDAESFKTGPNGNVTELGKKISNIVEVEAQYIGLIKISSKVIHQICEHYHHLDRKVLYENKNFDNMYMTSFIQNIIQNLMEVHPVYIKGGWIEIDSIDDLQSYEKNNIKF